LYAARRALSDSEIELARKTLKSVLKRLGIVLDLEWQNFTSFKT
jgi:hypothetical protein